MKIKIVESAELNGNIIVTFNSKVGTGRAVWRNNGAPRLIYEYDAEFDIDGPLEHFRVEFMPEEPEYSISIDGNSVILTGMIDSLDNDGMAYLRLSDDCLIMLESDTTILSTGERVRLKLDSQELEVTAQGE